MVSLEKVDDAIIYELQIQRGEPEPLRLISHDISTEKTSGSGGITSPYVNKSPSGRSFINFNSLDSFRQPVVARRNDISRD